MKTRRVPILLTSSVIAHDTSVALTHSHERARLSLESVAQWLRIDPTLQLVLCDGSSYDFADTVARMFPLADIECLHFENDQGKVAQYGRGFGEGEIVRYALMHSRIIAQAGCFAKCSSKLWVENFADCLSEWNGTLWCKGVFSNAFSPLKRTIFSYIDTRFYIANCEVYDRYFKNAHLQINRDLGHGLEECFRDAFQQSSLKNALCNIPPIICGVGGGTGTYYRTSFVRKYKEILRVKLVRANPKFSALFSKR